MSNWLPVLAYHRICDVPRAEDPLGLCTRPQDLERVLRYFRAHPYRFVSFDEAVEIATGGRPRRERMVCLTFDDGYRDFYTDAFPLLRRYGVTATVFLVSGFIGDSNRWDDHYGLPPVALMSEAEIKELAAKSIDFGSHTLSHPRLTQIGAGEQEREVTDSKKALEELLRRPVRSFCYPHMDFDERVQSLVRNAGYVSACGGEQAENSRYLLHRINVSESGWVSTLFRIWGWRYALQRSRRLRSLRHVVLPEPRPSRELKEVHQ